MRECYNIFLNELGPDSKNTKEAENWLEQLTQNAVYIAKNAKDTQARRLRAGIRFPPPRAPTSAPLGGMPAAATKAAAAMPAEAQVGGRPAMDARSIDELIKFIEGTDGQKKKSGGSGGSKKGPGRGGRTNPKTRRSATVVGTTV